MADNELDRKLDLLRSGEWMNGFSRELSEALAECEERCFQLNALPPSRREERERLVRKIFGSIGERFIIHSPLYCDFGFNIHIGENFASNFNLTILDEAEVRNGDNVFIGPNVTLCTITHDLRHAERNAGIMKALPIVIEDNAWLACNVTVLPGVTIGHGAVIGAGSVVTHDIPADTLALGSPCKSVRKIEQGDHTLNR